MSKPFPISADRSKTHRSHEMGPADGGSGHFFRVDANRIGARANGIGYKIEFYYQTFNMSEMLA